MYLEQFKIRACVLNSELPAAVRCLAVNQFNQDIFDIIIASDEKSLEQPDNANNANSKQVNSKKVNLQSQLFKSMSRISYFH